MKKVLLTLLALLALAAALCWPVLLWQGDAGEAASSAAGDGPVDPTTITDYDATFDVQRDGDLAVTERLAVEFPTYTPRHGIFRFWDLADVADPHVLRSIDDVEVTLDGGPVPVELSTTEQGRFTVAKIGDPDVFVSPGVHTYVLTYEVPGAVTPDAGGDSSTFYWDLVPAGWQQDITRTRLTVNLPAPAQDVQCGIGLGAVLEPCDVAGAGTTTLTVTTGRLANHTPVTLRTRLDLAVPAPETLPWTTRWNAVLGRSVPLLVGVVGAALVALLLGVLAARRARERAPGFPLLYTPPAGLGPAQAAYLLTESTQRRHYLASLMHAAERGAVRLDRDASGWRITDARGPEGWAGLDPVTADVAHLLAGPGTTFVLDRDSVSVGERMKTEIAASHARTKAWARVSGNLADIPGGRALALLTLVAGLGAAALAISNPFDMTALALVPGGFLLGGLGLLATGASTRRTDPQGRALWSQIGGFHRVLSTPSAKERFDFSGREELFTAYLPWAVAFDCADAWVAKFETETGRSAPMPGYFGAGGSVGSAVRDATADFSSSLDSAISAYDATQSKSSGGRGGFSGGGGGGGGGGGSW
ncbi:DUF2207 domain-containing protein [Nocardioides sp.]|uniref:DUF2207 domain-containing protein n=1 Tax=Nocardioides sp. TaxID=35761 RepID=UPI0035172A3A